jgi:two-component system, cell cycle sensor histidine kinase and response regulator CckA
MANVKFINQLKLVAAHLSRYGVAVLLSLVLAMTGNFASIRASDSLEHITLQLKYYHQFQFAGYYAAELCGFYADEGLKIDMRELEPGMSIEQVLSTGQAHFATYNAHILQRWGEGSELFLLAFIHQRNPHVLMVRKDSPYHSLADIVTLPKEHLVGPATDGEIDLSLALKQLGQDLNYFFPRKKNASDFGRFVAGDLLVYPGVLANEPARFREAGVDVRPLPLLPRQTIIPGDALICQKELWLTRPDLVERFRRASLHGWEYALSHPQEMIEHILVSRTSKFQSQTRDQLTQEAAITSELIDVDRFPLGDINIERLTNIVTLLKEVGLPGAVPPELIYKSNNPSQSWLIYLGILLSVSAFGFIILAIITRRQHRSLTESHGHYQNLIDTADGFFAFRARLLNDKDLHFEVASRSIEAILGYPLTYYQENPENFINQVHEEDRPVLFAHFKALLQQRQGRIRIRIRLRHPHSKQIQNLLLSSSAMRTAEGLSLDGIFIDFTSEALAEQERATLQAQLQSSQRNESLGLLASGVAHDFNNILSAIRGNAELIAKQVPPTHQHRIDRLFQAVDRASGLVRQILAYSGRGRVESKSLNLADELKQINDLLKHSLPKNVITQLSLDNSLPPVMFDPAQFQQVAVNLLVNAAESYEGKSGEVHVILDLLNDLIRLRVIDSGCGMDQATMARIFDPYFTTKDHGHGLGLAAVQGIIAGASGRITCESQPGKGTTFTLLLTPCASRTNPRIHTPAPSIPDGSQYALVADDDELVREITVESLTALGYTCLQANGGVECLRLLKEQRPRICLLVLDCRMPDLDGMSVLQTIRDRNDRLPVLLISGMINVDTIGTHLRDRRTRFLAKPFSQSQLSSSIEILFGSQIVRKPFDDSSRTAIMIADVIRQRQEVRDRQDIEKGQGRK